MNKETTIEKLSINTIRTLSIDAIERASSGHPGLPMGAAPMAYILWSEFMKHNPENSQWFNRDRFVLSAGHGSMLLYSLLHISGYDVTINDLKNFRQLGSKTPGHPEVLDTDGVETTTGPLGQGIATAVGIAMAEAYLAERFNKNDISVINHHTYALVSDGDLMEGISHEAASLAGHLELGKLIVLYDSNDISLDGELGKAFSEKTLERFKSYGWQVIYVYDGNDINEIRQALNKAKENVNQPSLIEVKTEIGYGSPNKGGTSKSHGAPLGKEEVLLTKKNYNWNYEPFYVPEEVYKDFRIKVRMVGSKAEQKWKESLERYEERYPDDAKELKRVMNDKLPIKWEDNLPTFEYKKDFIATREASHRVLNKIADNILNFLGGSADLASSNKTMIEKSNDFSSDNYSARNIWFGVREFAMAAALNGMALHGGLKVYGATFLVFSDYLRPALRLSALMKLPVTYVFTHDSIAVGEDGPTHQPIEHIASLRATPGLSVIRPADGNETQAAWRLAVESTDTPTALILSRQALPTLKNSKDDAYHGVRKGAYVVSESDNDTPDALMIATGSEVHLAIDSQKELKKIGIDVRVISMPSWDRFEKQNNKYKESILPHNIGKRIALEMGSSIGWERYVGSEGIVIGIDKFGASGKGEEVVESYGFMVENIVDKIKSLF